MRNIEKRFTVWDYFVFTFLLLISVLTGVYFKYRSKIFKEAPKENLEDYLTGARHLKIFPVAMTLVGSYISGVTMIGTPLELFNYGATYWLIIIGVFISCAVVAYVFMPIYTKLRVSSSYEYLELRFNKSLRIIASILFVFDELVFLPSVLYVPSLSFEQVSGVSLHVVSWLSCATCAFYVISGGINAVVYTDTWQIITMFVAYVIVLIVGTVSSGGFGPIFRHNKEGGRLSVSFNINLTERFTAWSVVFGGFWYWTSFNAVNQTMIQRYLALPNDRSAKISIAIFAAGIGWFLSMCCFAGMLMYDQYRDCDPRALNLVNKADQLLSLYVMETGENIPGLPGLFISGVFGAALSSMSVIFNSTSVVILEDILEGLWHINLSEKKARLISHVIVLLLSVLSCLGVIIVSNMGNVFEVAAALTSIVAGPMFGVYILGMLFPWSNSKGAAVGGLCGVVICLVAAFGNRIAATTHSLDTLTLPTSVELCNITYNMTVEPVEKVPPDTSVFPLFRLSYMWLTPLGSFVVILVGLPLSFLTGKTDLKTLDPDLISPVCKWILPEEAQQYAGTSLLKVQQWRLLEKSEKGEIALE